MCVYYAGYIYSLSLIQEYIYSSISICVVVKGAAHGPLSVGTITEWTKKTKWF